MINSADFSSNQPAIVLTTIIGDKHSDPSYKLEVMTSGYGMPRKEPVASIFCEKKATLTEMLLDTPPNTLPASPHHTTYIHKTHTFLETKFYTVLG